MALVFKRYGKVGTRLVQSYYKNPGPDWVPVVYETLPEHCVISADGGILRDYVALRNRLMTEINGKKNIMRDSGFVSDGILWDSDMAARTAYNEVALKFNADPEFTVPWKASNGNWVTLTAAIFHQVTVDGTAHIQNTYSWQHQKETELSNTSDEDLINFIV